jgi:predicted metal-dependent hydrolase
MAKGRTKRKLAMPHLPLQRQLPLAYEGRHFNLQEIFDRLNEKYFGRKFRNYTIMWGRKRRLKPKYYFVFGSIQEEDRVIRIHPLLDAAFVPKWFLEYVVYHEMCHAVVQDEVYPSGRRKVHTDEFYELEKKFPHYRKARRWEEENLARFLR